jgi:N-acyl-D-aspartate/D-glutamate deacylase
MFDVVIRGEAVLDGKGTPAFRADVGPAGRRITTFARRPASRPRPW